MKYIITEEQLDNLQDKVLKISFSTFGDDWDLLQRFLIKRGNPPYCITDDLDLRDNEEIETLGNLIWVRGNLDLVRSSIVSLGSLISVRGYLDLYRSNIESLGNLTTVGDSLNISETEITSLGNLTYVGGFLDVSNTPIKSLNNLKEIGDDLLGLPTPLESFGALEAIGGSLQLQGDFLRKKYSEKKIRDMINISGEINFYV